MKEKKFLEKLGILLCLGIVIIESMEIRYSIWLQNRLNTLELEKTLGTIKVPTLDEVISEGNSILQKFLLYSRISKILTFLLIILVIIMYFKMKKGNINIKEYKINCFLFLLTGIIGMLHHFFINTQFMGYILLISALLTLGLYIWTNFQNLNKENPINAKNKNIDSENKDFFLINKLPIIFYIVIFFINSIEIFDISNSFNRFKMLGYNFQVLGQQNEEEIRNFAFLVKKRMDWYSNISKISIFLLSVIFVLMFLKIKNKKDILERIKKNILMFFIITTGILKFYIIKNLNMNYLLIIMSLLAIVISIMKKFTNYLKKDNLIKGIDKSINLKILISIIILLNIVGLVFFMNRKNNGLLKIKSLEQLENSKNKVENISQDFEIKNGYKYKKSNGENSAFTPRNLGYAESLLNNQVSYDSLREEYCRTVNEIVKVDNGIMPGTTKPFEEATYTQVDDAYREHLQKIAQIRQVFDTIYGNDNDLENGAGCHYTGTHWNNANSQYKAKQFYDRSIIKYLNNHGYGIKNNASSTLKRKEKNLNDEREIERTIDETINQIDGTTNQIDQTQNNSSTNSDESDDEYSE